MFNYFKDTKTEMKHVTWPSVRQTVAYTVLVIAVSVAVAALLGFFDYLFSLLIQNII